MLFALGCAGAQSSSSTEAQAARLDALAASGAEADAAIDDLDERVALLHEQIDRLAMTWEHVERELRLAQQRMSEAARLYGTAAAAYREAKEHYEKAERNWRIVAASLMIAASSDKAINNICDGKMSRAQVRKYWKKAGIELNGKDADHIWPKSRGGADHILNFQALDSGINRSIGNSLGWKLTTQPLALLRGAAVSALVALRCG
ncbi:MAG: hypothetical protein HC927_00355 [Deltaproteobacteria bacterium]|nr:hypothetical protein [Deltaproteobacteria bacterium]